MNWPALESFFQPYVSPRWFEAWRVGRTRRAACVAESSAPPVTGLRRMFLDVSVISRHDAGTGIQRVVRAVAGQLMASAPEGWEVVPVGATRKRAYHRIAWPDSTEKVGEDFIQAKPGDVFVGLDFALDTVRFHEKQLREFKRCGGALWFVMYDLLPIQRPEWFSDKLVVRFRKWLRVLAAHADGFYCISSVVETDLRQLLAQRYALLDGYRTRLVPMGGDLVNSRPSVGIPEKFSALLDQIEARPAALMVGTLEPRKGHAEVLAAFDVLWAEKKECNLVIVGRPGWRTEPLQRSIRQHGQYGKRLFWLDSASDETLQVLYTASRGVIVASLAEGFGLPLIEALMHAKPVLARDIPVFRIHESKGVIYFPQEASSAELAGHVERWLAGAGSQVMPELIRLPTWQESADAFLAPFFPPKGYSEVPHSVFVRQSP